MKTNHPDRNAAPVTTDTSFVQIARNLISAERYPDAEQLLLSMMKTGHDNYFAQQKIGDALRDMAAQREKSGDAVLNQRKRDSIKFIRNQAIKAYEKAISYQDDDIPCRLEIARLATTLRLFGMGFYHTRQVLKRDRLNTDAWINMSALYHATNEIDRSTACIFNIRAIAAGQPDQVNDTVAESAKTAQTQATKPKP